MCPVASDIIETASEVSQTNKTHLIKGKNSLAIYARKETNIELEDFSKAKTEPVRKGTLLRLSEVFCKKQDEEQMRFEFDVNQVNI